VEKHEKGIRILICDDDPQDRKLIRAYLQMIAGRDVIMLEAGETAEIQRAIDVGELDIILMDLHMPDKSGTEWLKEIVEKQLAPVVILTGYGDEDSAVQSFQQGAVGYLPKRRLSAEALADMIDDAIEKWRGLMLSRGNFEQLERLANVDSVTGELIRQKFLKTLCKTIGCETMEALATIVEFRDPYTANHQQRVTHVHQHHERIDGSGYPLGLSGEDILLEARILAVADVVEAMASHRPYRPSLGLDYALHEIVKNKGKLYDPNVVDACLRVFRELAFEFRHSKEELPSTRDLVVPATRT